MLPVLSPDQLAGLKTFPTCLRWQAVINEGCKNVSCPMHMFHGWKRKIKIRTKGGKTKRVIESDRKTIKRLENNYSRKFLNCDLMVSEPMSLREVGSIYGLSQEGVRQIESKAIRKLHQDPNIADLMKKLQELYSDLFKETNRNNLDALYVNVTEQQSAT